VILSGGTGSRLWPLSREAYPKQLLSLFGGETLLQATAGRTANPGQFEPLVVIANAEHRFAVAEQLQAIGAPVGRVVLEPFGRNTAPATAVAAILALEKNPRAILLVMPADHTIGDAAGFRTAVDAGRAAAERGNFVLFGIRASRPVTGYGYMQLGEPVPGAAGVRRVPRFTQKPDAATAERYVAAGDYVWNSGIFLLPARGLIAEFERLHPELLACARAALAQARHDMDFLRLDPQVFAQSPSISIDHAIIERTECAAVIPSAFGWTDVGSWSALWEIGSKDANANVLIGDAVVESVTGSYIRSEGPTVTALGVEDLVIVDTDDALFICRRDRAADVRQVVQRLEQDGRSELL